MFEGIEGEFVAWMSHGDSVSRVPAGFQITGATADTPVAAMEDLERGYYALQFHPEVQHTPKGPTLLENFLQQIGIDRTWTPNNIVDSLTWGCYYTAHSAIDSTPSS